MPVQIGIKMAPDGKIEAWIIEGQDVDEETANRLIQRVIVDRLKQQAIPFKQDGPIERHRHTSGELYEHVRQHA